MLRKLILNPNFVPVPVHETDELFRNGIFEWNITCVIRMIEASEKFFFKTAIGIRSVSLSSLLKDEHVEAAGALIESEEIKHQWDDAADSLLAHMSGNHLSREYANERVAVLRYGQILERSGEEQAKAYLDKHLHFPEIREIVIRATFEQGDAEEAIRLAEAGETQDQGLPGLVYRWKKYRYEAYCRTG